MKQLIEDIVKTNDQDKWRQLIDTTHKDLLSQAYRLNPQGDLHLDALQESFISIYKNLNRFYLQNKKCADYDFTVNFSKWSRTIVRNKSLNIIRQRNNQNKLSDSKNNLPNIQTHIKENKKDSFELKEYLSHMLSSLKQKEHQLLALKYFEGMTNLEISTETGYQINSIPVLINRALGQLKKRFEHAGLVIAAATITEMLTQQHVSASVTTTIPPEVFHSIKSIPLKIGISAVTLKGLLMKSLLILISATVLSVSAFYLQTNAKPSNPTIPQKKESIASKKVSMKDDTQAASSLEKPHLPTLAPASTKTNNTPSSTNDAVLFYGIKDPLIWHHLPNI